MRQFDPNLTYFWEADWRDGFFRVRINEGGVAGRNIYDFGKPYGGFYRPEPHVVYLGGGPARGGPQGQTVPGMVIRQVWVSQRPRPDVRQQVRTARSDTTKAVGPFGPTAFSTSTGFSARS